MYFVLSPDFSKFMDIQQVINLELVRVFAEQGIEFAFPTQTVYLAGQLPNPSPAEPAAQAANS